MPDYRVPRRYYKYQVILRDENGDVRSWDAEQGKILPKGEFGTLYRLKRDAEKETSHLRIAANLTGYTVEVDRVTIDQD